MPQLSVVIITFNEEKNIARCLDSVKEIADDIVVVDSFSTDKTQLICEKYGVNFIQHEWEGYSASKNFANAQAKFDWVLSLDADEALSEELKKSILKAKEGNVPLTYKFNRLTNYCGKWIKHCGWYPDTKTRVFSRKFIHWEGTIHEQLSETNYLPIFLKGDCLHYSYRTVEEHILQTEKFTTLSAKDLYDKGNKANFIKLYLSPVAKFIKSYVFQLGILDGYYGFLICKISAYSNYLKYSKLKQLNKQ